MAIQSQFYTGTSLESRTFPSSKHIATKQHMAVWVQQVSDDAWVQTDINTYQLINNSCVLNVLLNVVTYKQLEVRVADTSDELISSPTDIAIVAAIADEVVIVAGIETEVVIVAGDSAVIQTVAGDTIVVNIVAGDTIAINIVADDTVALNLVADDLAKGIGTNQPTDSAILNALTNANQTIADVVLTHADVVITNGDVVLTNADVILTHADVVLTNADVVSSGINATNAQLFEWEAEAERLTATSYALEAEDVPVNLVTSDGDGTFTYTPQAGVFSALHYSIKAGTFNPALYALLTGATFTGMVEFAKGADVASAAALPIIGDGNSFDVTGTTAITSIDSTGAVGTEITLHFNGILTLTHHATNLFLNANGENILTSAGDIAKFEEYATGDFRCTSYTRADGTAVVATAGNLLAEYEVTGAAVTSIDFSGLDINTHESYRVELEIINATASGSVISCFINNDTTITNYYSQFLSADATTVSAGRFNSARIAYLDASVTSQADVLFNLIDGYTSATSMSRRGAPSSLLVQNISHMKSATVSNITQLTFVSTVASAIGIGSKIRIYRGDV